MRGQSSIEYLVVSAALIAALLTPVSNGKNCLQLLGGALKKVYHGYAYGVSVATLPDKL